MQEKKKIYFRLLKIQLIFNKIQKLNNIKITKKLKVKYLMILYLNNLKKLKIL